MDPVSSGRPSEKGKPSTSTPLKPLAPAAAQSSSRSSPSDQIATPEKPIELSRPTRNRGVAFSVKEVKRIAAGLQRSNRDSAIEGEIGEPSVSPPPSSDSVALRSDKDAVQSQITVKHRVQLPEKYEILLEFFNFMVSSIRLLQLKGHMSSFSNISKQVESLTNRGFSHGHLAQLRYILPEAICIKKILFLDEATSCMKPDLQVTLQIDAFGLNKEQKRGSGYSMLNKAFRNRLLEFSIEHPDGTNVPEMDLPEPFNQTNPHMVPRMTTDSGPKSSLLNIEMSSVPPSQQQSVASSHMPLSFQRRFSRKVHVSATEKAPVSCFTKESPDEMPLISMNSSHVKYSAKPPMSIISLLSLPHVHLSSVDPSLTKEENGEKPLSDEGSLKEDIQAVTPLKSVFTPARLMSITPQLQTPKRCWPDAGEDLTPVKTIKRPTRTKLFHTPVKNAKTENEETETVDDVLQFLPKSLLQSVREKERKVLEDQEAVVADPERRKWMLACMPKLFDMIHLLFQSTNRSVITKQELIHKIIASHLDIVDRSEVEEQLNVLQELVPDWISVKMASSGDHLFCVNNISNPQEVRQRLSEAK